MVWQEKTLVIVMTTALKEGRTTKCFPYWPRAQNETVLHGEMQIRTVAVESNKDYTTTLMEISNSKVEETRDSRWFFMYTCPISDKRNTKADSLLRHKLA
jgi:protein tyrosine phosphatase